jgi:hypothetical protein
LLIFFSVIYSNILFLPCWSLDFIWTGLYLNTPSIRHFVFHTKRGEGNADMLRRKYRDLKIDLVRPDGFVLSLKSMREIEEERAIERVLGPQNGWCLLCGFALNDWFSQCYRRLSDWSSVQTEWVCGYLYSKTFTTMICLWAWSWGSYRVYFISSELECSY